MLEISVKARPRSTGITHAVNRLGVKARDTLAVIL
jgi:hypothetical protein